MPNRLSKDKRRVTYTEWVDVFKDLQEIAKHERLDMADIVRRATLEFIENRRKKRSK